MYVSNSRVGNDSGVYYKKKTCYDTKDFTKSYCHQNRF